VLALIFAGYPAPQTAPAPEGLTLAKLESAIKTYFRDSAEFPLHMETALVATDASGRVRQRKTGKADYDFHGYNPRSRNAAGHLYGSSSTMGAARNVMLATMLPFTVFDVDAAEHSPLKVSDSDAAGRLLTATIPQLPECAEFQWSAKHSAPGLICGASEFQLQKDDLELQRFSFDAGGLPVSADVKPFGRCQLRRYHIEEEFQKTFLAGDPKPFLVPKRVEVTIDTDKGTVVESSLFSVRK
jgi:hypothetical protein